jgi:hypothetical protein
MKFELKFNPITSISTSSNNKNTQKANFIEYFNLDLPLFILILSNIVTIIFAIYQNWSLITLMWIFWFQSIIIGIFNFVRILTLKNFSTENFKLNGQNVEPTTSTKYYTAFFFLFHYGFFHVGYLIFLLIGSFTHIMNKSLPMSGLSFILILISIAIFFGNHLFSFIYNYEKDSKKVRNIGTIMFFPYARIIPMHLTIVFGLFLINSKFGLIFFLVLKTIADIVMHQIEHNI